MSTPPHVEPGWNPYRWVEVPRGPVRREPPSYRHRFEGLSGRFECTLEALTPLFVGDGSGRFFGLAGAQKRPLIPGTSLKGAVRSLAEVVGNAAVPFPKSDVDAAHRFDEASEGGGPSFKLDVVARTFGHLAHRKGGGNFAGLVRFSDAAMTGSPVEPHRWSVLKVVAGHPKPTHRTFYPTDAVRKFYHHKTGSAELTGPQANIHQTRPVSPAPPGTAFRFVVDFDNLRDDELALLTYCLVLEDEVAVTLSPEALGPGFNEPVTLQGPMRHKLGGCKPQGGGSVHLRVERLTLRDDPAARYRAGSEVASVFEGPELEGKLAALTAAIASRGDATMQQLRAMLVYAADDPRPTALDYPSYAWFQEDRELPPAEKGRLKPTL
jgi:hypothetical protein